MFRLATFLLFLPSFFIVGGVVAFYLYFPPTPFSFEPSAPPKSSSYQRYNVVKELFLPNGETCRIGCEEALLIAPRKGFGEWSERWVHAHGEWKNRSFQAKEAIFFFSGRRLEATGVSLQEDDHLAIEAASGEFHLLSSPPLCRLQGGVRGKGVQQGKPFHFESPSLVYQGKEVVSSEGGLLQTPFGWTFPFEGELRFDGDHLDIAKGKIVGESEHFAFEGHSLHADVVKGEISDIHLADGVTLTHRLTRHGDPIQQGDAEMLDIHLQTREGLLSGQNDERALFVDKTHGIQMEVDALYFRFDEKGEIEGMEGRGEMTISTSKEGKS